MALDVRCAWRLDGRGAGGSEQGEHGEQRRARRASGRSPGRTIPVMNEVLRQGSTAADSLGGFACFFSCPTQGADSAGGFCRLGEKSPFVLRQLAVSSCVRAPVAWASSSAVTGDEFLTPRSGVKRGTYSAAESQKTEHFTPLSEVSIPPTTAGCARTRTRWRHGARCCLWEAGFFTEHGERARATRARATRAWHTTEDGDFWRSGPGPRLEENYRIPRRHRAARPSTRWRPWWRPGAGRRW